MTGFDLMNHETVQVNDVGEWMFKNDENFQNVCSGSDSYANIEKMDTLDVSFKLLPISSRGYVILENPEEHPNTFSPSKEAYCFFDDMTESGVGFREGMTLHDIKQQLSIGYDVPINKIRDIISFLEPQTQIILHKCKEDVFIPKYAK
jgi:hypothetical protein